MLWSRDDPGRHSAVAESEEDTTSPEPIGAYGGDGGDKAAAGITGVTRRGEGHGWISLADFAVLRPYFTGPEGSSLDPGCQRGDIDRCGATDLLDCSTFRIVLTGP